MEYLNVAFYAVCTIYLAIFVFGIATGRASINTEERKLDKILISVAFSCGSLWYLFYALDSFIKILS